MTRSPRRSITWTTVAATVAAAVISALTLAVNEQGSLARMGSEGRAMARLGTGTKSGLGSPAAATSPDVGRDEPNRRGPPQP
ncbi:MAG: hypothetical protein ABIO45_18160 [Burkholderiaceae bacterium]